MNAAIQNTISQYVHAFIEKVSVQYNLPRDEVEGIWKETQKEKIKLNTKRRVSNANKTNSAYINFCNHNRKKIKSETPDLTFGQMAKALGALWKTLDVEEKKKYSDPEYVGETSAPPPPVEEKKPKRSRKNKE